MTHPYAIDICYYGDTVTESRFDNFEQMLATLKYYFANVTPKPGYDILVYNENCYDYCSETGVYTGLTDEEQEQVDEVMGL